MGGHNPKQGFLSSHLNLQTETELSNNSFVFPSKKNKKNHRWQYSRIKNYCHIIVFLVYTLCISIYGKWGLTADINKINLLDQK